MSGFNVCGAVDTLGLGGWGGWFGCSATSKNQPAPAELTATKVEQIETDKEGNITEIRIARIYSSGAKTIYTVDLVARAMTWGNDSIASPVGGYIGSAKSGPERQESYIKYLKQLSAELFRYDPQNATARSLLFREADSLQRERVRQWMGL
jgi:hypothetical protein